MKGTLLDFYVAFIHVLPILILIAVIFGIAAVATRKDRGR